MNELTKLLIANNIITEEEFNDKVEHYKKEIKPPADVQAISEALSVMMVNVDLVAQFSGELMIRLAELEGNK